ncbi:WXG100 family type VII secretion target [Mycobacteroides abscessus]|uniref:WXG100 family type VII secretion target n=1 Tax=Mycobacteroides abscessus TaxID=36809 RepID=UPI0002E31485|nr:WXG100 family type VII secretion target [Mycobacteroides abscessus]SLB64553.1 WXG100 family type VII secretion target [Mycobacteroides abscessus subsp. abscessus]
MTVLHARFAEMIAAAEHLIQSAEQVKSRYGMTKADVEQLLDGSWKGIAPEVHRELWADWDEGFELVQAAMLKMGHYIRATAVLFREVDADGLR